MAEQKKSSRSRKAGLRKAASKRNAPNASASLAKEPPTKEQADAMARALMVRRFVTACLANNMNASAALREIRPDVTKRSSRTIAYELLQCEDVSAELFRQLQGLSAHADLNEQWVYAQLRAMAHSNIFDYVDVDEAGNVAVTLRRERLTLEQQLAVRRLKFDKKTGRVVDLELIDRKSAVDSIAKAQGMFRDLEAESMAGLAQEIAERMQRASKQIPRTFDSESGEEIE